jgi:hypothetical protein
LSGIVEAGAIACSTTEEQNAGMESHGIAQKRMEPPKRLFRVTNRTREGRFLKHCEAQLVAQLGVSPSFAQFVLARRAARAMLQLEQFDAKMTKNWTDHDARTYGGLNNALRLCLRELGIKAAPRPEPTLAELMAASRQLREASSA